MDQARILIVEDDSSIAELLVQLLEEDGYAVECAPNGAIALERAAQINPDLVLLDLMLPDVDGFEVLQRLRERDETQAVPVVMLTALTQARDRVRGIRSGADDYLTKPFDAEELLSRIALRLAHARRETGQRDAAVQAGLQAISHAVATPDTVAGLVVRVVDLTRTVLEGAACGILLWNEGARCFQPAGCVGLEEAQRQIFAALQIPLGVSAGVDALVAEHRPFHLDSQSTSSLSQAVLHAFEKEAILVAPMLQQGSLYGMLILGRNKPAKPFAEADEELIRRLADQAALALGNQATMEQLEHLAITDYLTGLYNARYFHEFLARQLAQAQQSSEPTSIFMLELDHFTRINDGYGHLSGDAMLVSVAGVLRDAMRDGDVAVRYSGDEFGAILPATSREEALALAEAVLQRVRDLRVDAAGIELRITASVGVASSDGGDTSPTVLLRAADRALHQAKWMGRNRVV